MAQAIFPSLRFYFGSSKLNTIIASSIIAWCMELGICPHRLFREFKCSNHRDTVPQLSILKITTRIRCESQEGVHPPTPTFTKRKLTFLGGVIYILSSVVEIFLFAEH
jgi:hypothetical protein